MSDVAPGGATEITQVLHVTTGSAWWAAVDGDGLLRPPSLELEGFVHCCTDDQLDGVLRRFWPDRTDAVVLRLEVSALPADQLRWEAPAHPDGSPATEEEAGHRFPHLYGPVPTAAVVSVRPLD